MEKKHYLLSAMLALSIHLQASQQPPSGPPQQPLSSLSLGGPSQYPFIYDIASFYAKNAQPKAPSPILGTKK